MTKPKQWSVCQDSLEPLADKLRLLASRFGNVYDFNAIDQLDNEYQTIRKASPHSDHSLTDAQRTRLAELSKLISAWKEPPCPRDVEMLYEEHHIGRAGEYLKAIVSFDYAADFTLKLLSARKRFFALDFKASQILNGDIDKASTTGIRYAIPRLIDQYYEQLHAAFPGREEQPTGDELPDHLRKMEVEILDEYEFVEQGIRKVAEYLGTVVILIRGRVAGTVTSSATLVKPKRSTKRTGDLIIAALASHHKYANGNCLNLEPIGNNKMARDLGLSPGTTSSFFNEKFRGYAGYVRQCRDAGLLRTAMRLLNNEITPAILSGGHGQKRIDPDTLHVDRKRPEQENFKDTQKRIDEQIDRDPL